MAVNRAQQLSVQDDDVSIIVSSKRPIFLANIFANYRRQVYRKKELIIVLNHINTDLTRYTNMAKRHRNVSVYRVDDSASLGECLNFAVSKSKFPIITKFDDDDYYSPYYINGVLSCFRKSNTDVLGKNTCYLYLKNRKLLLLFHPNRTHMVTDLIMGSTLAFRRHVFNTVRFRHVSRGEDTYFFEDCAKKQIAIYSCDPYNYVCIRRSNGFNHTWTIDEKTLMEHSIRIARTSDFTKYITRRR